MQSYVFRDVLLGVCMNTCITRGCSCSQKPWSANRWPKTVLRLPKWPNSLITLLNEISFEFDSSEMDTQILKDLVEAPLPTVRKSMKNATELINKGIKKDMQWPTSLSGAKWWWTWGGTRHLSVLSPTPESCLVGVGGCSAHLWERERWGDGVPISDSP